LLFYLLLPLLPVAIVWMTAETQLPMFLRIILSIALILPIAPLLDRVVFRPIADASVLLLLTVAVALHFGLVGLGLLFFGAEGVRTQPLADVRFEMFGTVISMQTVFVVAAAFLFSALLYAFFDFTITGKALRATAINRTGARLVGIRPAAAGTVAYLLGSALAGISGILISPVTTIFYDSGFLISLKAFVGAIIGAMVSYPVTAIGAISVGLLESFASFWNSAFKEVIVFSILIPVLLWRSLTLDEDEEEAEA
jgi:branched-chain amino acid transport system permease protein